jgi:hypothetical protein
VKRSQTHPIRFSSPQEIQDFLNKLPFNFEKKGETYMSVQSALKSNTAHCFEGALIASFYLQQFGHKPLILDLKTTEDKDVDHVVALFQIDGCWGAISKTNHAVLRYREPIYKTVRELAMSYFHEYFLPNGEKTLRSYSKPFDLLKTKIDWVNSEENLFNLMHELDKSSHINLLSTKQIKNLRRADKIEIKAGEITEYN